MQTSPHCIEVGALLGVTLMANIIKSCFEKSSLYMIYITIEMNFRVHRSKGYKMKMVCLKAGATINFSSIRKQRRYRWTVYHQRSSQESRNILLLINQVGSTRTCNPKELKMQSPSPSPAVGFTT